MKRLSTANLPPIQAGRSAFRRLNAFPIFFLSYLFLFASFNSFGEERLSAEDSVSTAYRYLRLNIQEGVSNKKLIISEINWLVGAEIYPQSRITSPTPRVSAPGTRNPH